MTASGTAAWLRTRNDRVALELLLEHGALSRSQLSALSGLSRPTAGQILTRLGALGLIAPTGHAAGARGPSATTYGVRADAVTGVAVSVLADGIDAVLVDPTDAEHPFVHVPIADVISHQGGRSPAGDVREAVEAACRAAGVSPATVSAVTVGVQAAVDVDGDAVSAVETLDGWPARGIRSEIEEATGLRVRLENDVNLATRAERQVATMAEVPSFAYLWLGQGLGVGIDLDGIVRRGAFSSAGEIGYLEAPRSAAALAPRAHDITDLLGGAAVVRMLGGSPTDTLRAMLPRLRGNDAIVEQLALRVAMLVAPILTVLDPAVFVLGGPTADAAGPRLAELVQAQVAAEAHPTITPTQVWARMHVDVRTSRAGTQPILQGARVMLVEELRERLEARITAE